nr:zf-HC2 domain-containing protein [Nakamurella flavida]
MLGAFALGRLDDRERTAVQAHLDGCADCRAELDEIAPVVAALAGLDADRVHAPAAPPPELGENILASVRTATRERNRSRWVRRAGGGALIAAALVGVFVLGVNVRPVVPAAPPVIALQLQDVASGVQADAGLVRHTWGTELKLQASGLAAGGAYTVTFVREDGGTVPGGTFLGTGTATLTCSMNGALPLDDTAEVQITDAAGVVVMDAVVA